MTDLEKTRLESIRGIVHRQAGIAEALRDNLCQIRDIARAQCRELEKSSPLSHIMCIVRDIAVTTDTALHDMNWDLSWNCERQMDILLGRQEDHSEDPMSKEAL